MSGLLLRKAAAGFAHQGDRASSRAIWRSAGASCRRFAPISKQFRKSGKPIYAYLKTPGAREYYLATAANAIYMDPEDELNLKGMRFELMYFNKTLDKLGVQVEIEHAGKYKDFGDMFTRTSMSPETKEVLTSVLDDLYGNLVQTHRRRRARRRRIRSAPPSTRVRSFPRRRKTRA